MIQDVAQKRAGSLAGGMGVNHIYSYARYFQISQVGRQHGLELLNDDLKSRVAQEAAKLLQHHRVGREEADLQF